MAAGGVRPCSCSVNPQAPASFGSDEIGITFLTTGLFSDGSYAQLKCVTSNHKNMDSGDTVVLPCVLLTPEDQDQPMPLVAITTVVIGYEIDNYDAYVNQVRSFKDAFVEVMSWMWKVIAANTAVDVVFALAASSGWPLVIALIGAAIFVGMAAIFAAWAPADLMAQDTFVLSMGDLIVLTSGIFPSPPPQSYVTDQSIKVDVEAVEKGASDYLERRKYRCDDEDSEYHVTLRYTRVQ